MILNALFVKKDSDKNIIRETVSFQTLTVLKDVVYVLLISVSLALKDTPLSHGLPALAVHSCITATVKENAKLCNQTVLGIQTVPRVLWDNARVVLLDTF